MSPHSMADEPASLYDAFRAHQDALRHQRRADATLKVYRLYVGGFVEFLHARGIEQPTLEHLTPAWLARYQDAVGSRGTGTRGGAAAEYQAVRSVKIFSKWLWRRSFVEVDPLARVETPRLSKLHRTPFSQSDCERLLEAASLGPDPVLERTLLLLGLDTGARIGELCAAEVGDVDLAAGTILFRHTKTRRPRRVYFRVASRPDGGPTVVALAAWFAVRLAEPGVRTLFTTRFGKPLTPDRARRIYRALGDFANVKNPIPHRARHTHATEFLAEMPGAELHLRNRLGHISHDVLENYVSISDTSARQVADVASVSSKWGL